MAATPFSDVVTLRALLNAEAEAARARAVNADLASRGLKVFFLRGGVDDLLALIHVGVAGLTPL